MMIASKNNGFGHGIYITIPRIKQPIELFVLFRALGIIADKEICKHIVLNIEAEENEENKEREEKTKLTEPEKQTKRLGTVYDKLHLLIDKTPEEKAEDLLTRVEAIYNMMQMDLKRKRI